MRMLGPLLMVGLTPLLSQAAGYRTQNFIITAPSRALAKEIGDAAEHYRQQMAIEWLGQELPPWDAPCPVNANVAPHLGAGGSTSFMFDGGTPFGWRMTIQGPRDRLLDSVLPHEVTHTVFATHFGRPVPRWADEGACTTVEHDSEREKQKYMLIEFMTSNPPRSIPFNKMFRIKEYPRDIMPLYSQGFSLSKFLIGQGGKRRFIDYLGHGMQTDDWDGATQEFYGYRDLSELQVKWVDWVRDGSPILPAADDEMSDELLAAAPRRNPAPATTSQPTNPPHSIGGVDRIQAPTSALANVYARADRSRGGDQSASMPASWYARQKWESNRSEPGKSDSREAAGRVSPQRNQNSNYDGKFGLLPQSTARAMGPQQTKQRVLEWDDRQTANPAPKRANRPSYYDRAPANTFWR